VAEPGFILNVNDDEASRYLISRMVKAAGFAVREAATGMDALAIARDRPRLVILDVQLPDISGLEVCRRIKASPETADIPVLQTSATFVTADRKVQGLESGADGYLTQPVEPTELIATIRALLRASLAEQGVRDAAVDWQRTFDGLAESVLVVDASGRVQRCNQAAHALLREVPVQNRPIDELLAQAFTGWQPETLESARRTRRRSETELRVDGRWLRLTADPILDASGAVDRVVLVIADVTDGHRVVEQERRRAAEYAEESRRKDQYLAMLAHELRNPLNAISSAASLLERSDGRAARDRQHLGIVTRQVRHLSRMVDDLLEVSRLTRGQVVLKRKDIDLRQVLEQAIRLAAPLVESRRQRVVTTMPAAPVVVSGDALRLEQVFANLLNNAAKYSEPATTILVSCVLEPGDERRVTVRVRDHGVGIPPEHLTRVFDVFMQVDESLARSLGGLGIGLTVARSLVEMHGGEIEALSDGQPGHGSELVVRLPTVARPPEQVAPAGEVPAWRPQRSLNVLVVEDNDESAELLRTLLEMWNHRVQVARDGIAGIDAALSSCPDVALLDIGLPGVDGYQVAATLRASPATRHVYLVAITGYGKPEDRARALDAGFNYYIVKPVHFEELEQVLADFTRTGTAGAATP
jgi:signal transduction histidine kinase